MSGQFLSADSKQGNMQGMDPYSYVGGNPETRTDPTGERYIDAPGGQTGTITSDPSGGTDITVFNNDGSINEPIVSGHIGAALSVAPHPTIREHSLGQLKQSKTTSGCNKGCGDDDRQLIQDYLKKMAARADNAVTLIGDIIGFLGDALSAVVNFLAENVPGGVTETVSAIIRLAVIAGDLGKLGISMPASLIDFATGLRGLATIVDVAQSIFGFFNPLTGVVNKLGMVIKQAVLQRIGTVAQWVASIAAISGITIGPNWINAFYWDNQITAASGYSNQQAHNVCVQDYASEPSICQ